MDKCPTCPYFGEVCGQPTACPGFPEEEVECCEGPLPQQQPIEFVVRFSLREMKKIAYLSRKARKTQERRNRPGDVMLLEGIEDKVQRTLLGF
jgi:hypothetical protein